MKPVLAVYVGLFILFLYGPFIVLGIISFQQGPEGGPQFPIIEWSTYWYRHLFGMVPPSRIAPLPVGDALIRSLTLAFMTMVTATVLGVMAAQAFRKRFRGAAAASREMGFDIGPLHLIAVENTADTHNLIVCTLCSCYPRNLLGLPPDWYKTRAYRSRAVREPRAVLSEFGVVLPDHVTVRVHDSTADMRYIVLPARPSGTEDLSESELAAWVTRDSMIGTGLPRAPDSLPATRA